MAERQSPDGGLKQGERRRELTGGQSLLEIKRFSGIHDRISWLA
jgi:hypothetical protein